MPLRTGRISRTMHPVIGYSDERILMYVADTLSHVGANLDEGEFVDIVHRDAGRGCSRGSTAARSPMPRR